MSRLDPSDVRVGEGPAADGAAKGPPVGRINRAELALALGFFLISRAPMRWQTVGGMAFAVLIGAESLSVPTPMMPVETPAEIPPVYRWLASQIDGAPALELPTIEARWLDQTGELDRQGHELYLSIFHWHPTPSGFSGFEPPLFWSVIREAKDFPNDESVNFFQCLGVKYVIFHQNQFATGRWQQIAGRIGNLSTVLRPMARFGEDSVYELRAPNVRERAPTPRLTLPSAVSAGSDYRGFLVWPNLGAAGRLARPASITAHATWRHGTTVSEQSATVSEPACLARGDTTVAVDLLAPRRTGRYDLTVSADGATTTANVAVVTPPTGPVPDDPRPAMQLVSGQVSTPIAEAGGVVSVRADWRLRHRTVDNYLLRLEVRDNRGQVVASSTVDPFNGALETGRWLPDETVRVGESAILPRTLPPGPYTVRLLVRFADGAVWKMAGPDNNDHDSVDVGTVRVG